MRPKSVAKMKAKNLNFHWVAGEGANIRKGYWCCNFNPIVAKASFAERLNKAEYLNFLDYNESVCV